MISLLDKRNKPKPRPKTAAEQREELLTMLEEYQKDTTRMVLNTCGIIERNGDCFGKIKRIVSGKLKAWNQEHEPKSLDIEQLRKSLSVRAPYIRDEVLLMAKRGEIKL